MLTTKLTLRLLDEAGVLLGWTDHDAAIRGDGCLRASADVVMQIEREGVPHTTSIHWADVNVETRVPAQMPDHIRVVRPPDHVTIYPAGDPIITVGEPPYNLPPITVRKNVQVGIPPGALGAVGRA